MSKFNCFHFLAFEVLTAALEKEVRTISFGVTCTAKLELEH